LSQEIKRRDSGIKVRIKFSKHGPVKFIGHLDIMRYFQKLLRRAELDMMYTEGFHPHQVMSFANPLGVGLESEGEYLDITLNSAGTAEEMVNALNAQSVEGIHIVSARRLPLEAGNGMASVAMADYRVIFSDMDIFSAKSLTDITADFYGRDEILVEKKTKKGFKEVDLKKSVHILRAEDNSIFMKVNAGSAENIRPEMVTAAMFEHAGLSLEPFSYQIVRLEQYESNGRTLEDVGMEF